MGRHKWADLIIAWAEGATIQYQASPGSVWKDYSCPIWDGEGQYRIKPAEPPKWYDNIPTQGVLCWVNDDDAHNKIKHIRVVSEYLSGGAFPFKGRDSGVWWSHAVPLTNDEIKQFLREEE